MARRSTIADVASAAGVSVATVDRVLNGREKVRETTARQVFEAAQRVGYHAAGLIGQRLRTELPVMRFGFVLHKERQAFYQNFAAEADRAARTAPGVRGMAEIAFSASQAPSDFARQMRAMMGKVDAIAATAITHHEITEAVEDLKTAGIPCFSLLNDFAPGIRQNYVGMNNIKVGRIAASMIATAVHRPGKVAVFVGGYRWHGHELRETGFRSYFREYAPEFTILDTLVNLETRQLTYEATLDLLGRHPDLSGIYCAGGGMEGAIAALREARAPGEVALVVNELTPESRAALLDRYLALVIATPLAELCRDVVALMTSAVTEGPSNIAGQHFLMPHLYLPESI
ncbi:MAG: LacI family DNA-binding transcriptional regulator [Rhodobacteraceae bacterium]|nr:LacI family DNA-binding transcriptional regulator [Paracoccaceae bacterium]